MIIFKQNKWQEKSYWVIFFTLTILLITNYFDVSNDGRHYLSAAESLKSNLKYFSLGYSPSADDLWFLPDWPPIYPMLISIFSITLKISVLQSVKLLHILLFIIVGLQIFSFKFVKYKTLFRFSSILILFNSGHFTSSNAEVLFYPMLFIVYFRFDWFRSKSLILGVVASLFYLIKYTFIFVMPTFLLLLIIDKLRTDNFLNKDSILCVLKSTSLFVIGFLVLFLLWHLIILFNTNNFFPAFIGAIREVDTFQFFRDFIISWNFFPERYESNSFLLGLVIYCSIVLMLIFLVFKKIYKKPYNKPVDVFWEIILLAWLSFFLLEAFLHGISTKRYLDGAELILFIVILRYRILEINKQTLIYPLIFLFVLQLIDFAIDIKNLKYIRIIENEQDKRNIDILSEKLSSDNSVLFTLDKGFASGIVEFKNWKRITQLDSSSILTNKFMKDPTIEKILLIQNRDTLYLNKITEKDVSRIKINR